MLRWMPAFVATAALAAEQPAADLDEVLVQSDRAALAELRAQVVALEQKFYDRYNELNLVDDFDVRCEREARLGTRLKSRACRAVYMDRAMQEEGRDAFIDQQRIRDAAAPLAAGSTSPPVPAQLKIDARRPQFQQNMRSIVERHPELVEILREREAVGVEFERVRRRIAGAADPQETDAGAGATP